MTPVSLFAMIPSCFGGEEPPPADETTPPPERETTSLCEMPYVYNPESPPTFESLISLGGDPFLIYAFSDGNDVVTPELAATLSLTLKNVGDACKARALFLTGVPPDGASAVTILGNANGMALEPNVLQNTHVVPENQYSYADLIARGFTDQELSGIFFTDGATWQRAGNSVVQINVYNDASTDFDEQDKVATGSGVFVSRDESTILTARHVLYGEDGTFSNTAVSYRGRTYPIAEGKILFQNEAADLAAVRVPELRTAGDLIPARIASRAPETDETVMAIGFPKLNESDGIIPQFLCQSMGSFCNKDRLRLYSTGTYVRTSILGVTPHDYFEISNRVYFGDSGGGLFNADGELIGILSSIDTQKKTSYAGSLLPEDTPYPDFSRQLAELRNISGERP